ncbi:hypothetical protein [Segetibacter koreensis]|uniref:hypothetical protein n=1 Tax=Segetibacter koreensis TaxID=398037 RepID=UPI00037EC39F|nr:hypothetical protein [Segetibacter koreensis]
MKNILVFILATSITSSLSAQSTLFTANAKADSFIGHKVILDKQSKIVSWITPQSSAYSKFLHQRWNFIKTRVPNSPGPKPRSSYPQYYFYCAYLWNLEPDTWMNDVGEKIPNWFESARLYYAYTGDTTVMTIVKKLIDYTIAHGTSPSTFAWPNFPYTTTNAGDTIFRGFTSAGRFVLHEIQVDHAGDMGLTYYRLYLYTGEEKYKTAAVNVANTLALKARTGSATKSVWPYRVVMSTGEIKAEYGANWIGCYSLLDNLVKAKIGNICDYQLAMDKTRNFILQFPMKTGYWTDGHTDNNVNSNTYKSNMSASNAKLYMFDHPEFDTAWKTDIPKLIKWTEDNFVTRCAGNEPANMWGANIVGEQDGFLIKMDYQTARYAAECARWYAISGDEKYKDKAYRSFNWVTYCNDSTGRAFESPVSNGISNWWSDCYGEGPRMFYPALGAIPEWAPLHENHILYSEGILKKVFYKPKRIEYRATSDNGTEYLRLAFKPVKITLNGKTISLRSDLRDQGYVLKSLANGDYAVTIKRMSLGNIIITGL